MKTIFHYDAGPALMARLAALATEGFEVTPCPEEDDGYFAALLPDAEVLLHVLKPVTAGSSSATLDRSLAVAVKNMRWLRDGRELLFRAV